METVAKSGDTIVQDLVLANREEAVHVDIKSTNVCHLLNVAKGRFKSQLKAKSMTLNIDCAADFSVLADESGLNRVFDNLISNAVKFSNAATGITIQARVQNGSKEISISDSGPGIAENEMHKLFKRYAKLSAKPTNGESSTGLGLFIVKTLLEKMNASIKVDSKLGEGSTFTLVFHA